MTKQLCCGTGKEWKRGDAGCNTDFCTGPKPAHNGGLWTDARKKSFIVSLLRGGFQRWGPKQDCIRKARTRRGWYRCEECKKEVPATLPPKEGNKRRIKNIVADHITPIIDPTKGFEGFDKWVERGFVEAEGFQALCHSCHQIKCTEERNIATKRRRSE